MISEDTLLSSTKLIAEPWDAAGLYQLGSFAKGPRWSVWNGKYRDDVRRFWRGDPGMTSAAGHSPLRQRRSSPRRRTLCTRSTSSPATTGSLLRILLLTIGKHNEANGEGNLTEPTPTGAGTAASRGPATIPRCRSSGAARPAT